MPKAISYKQYRGKFLALREPISSALRGAELEVFSFAQIEPCLPRSLIGKVRGIVLSAR